jgi:Electron transfer flavoprotein, beta subunit
MEVHQETEEGYNIVSLEYLAVVTVSKLNYDPRYPTIKSKMASRKAVIPTYSAAKIGEVKQGKVCCIEYVEPPKKEATLAVSAVMEQMKKDKAI